MKAPAVIVILLLFVAVAVTVLPSSTRAVALPSYVVYSVPIVLNNQQSIPTPSPFQQMITVNSAQFSTYEASNLQNVAFFYSNGTVIPSWLESGNSNTTTSTVYWLRLANGIPAQSSITIYMGFATTSTNLMNNQMTGEAPDLSAPSGKYDDGSNVFLAYGDFDLGLGAWTPYSSAGNFLPTATNNGVEMLDGTNGEMTFLIPQASIPEIPTIIEYSWEYSGGADSSSVSAFGLSPISSGLTGAGEGQCQMKDSVCAVYWYYNQGSYLSQSIAGSNVVAHGSFPGGGTFHIVSQLTVSSSTSASAGYVIGALSLDNFPQTPVPALLSGSIPNPFGSPTLMLLSNCGGSTSYQYIHWIVARAYPPNGNMPSVAVGTPTTQTSSTSSQATTTITVASTTTATIMNTQTVISTTTLPATTYTTQLPPSTMTETITKTVTHTVTTTPSSTSITSVSSSSSSTGPQVPFPPSSIGLIVGIVVVALLAFILVRVVFWRRIIEIRKRYFS